MNKFPKIPAFLPALIALQILVYISCTSADIEPLPLGSSSSAAEYCYNSYGFDECVIIGIFNQLDDYYEYYWLDADGCVSDGGTVVERDWCVANGYQIFDD